MAGIFNRLKKGRARGAGREDVPHWEYFNRISFVSGRLKALTPPPSRVLDVGGAPGNNLLRRSGHQSVWTLDLDPKADVVASADNIPLKEGAFEAVTCIDTLEHIPVQVRDRVIEELVRVASRAVFIVAPVDTEENTRAEELVLKHQPNKRLEEHRLHGLVDFVRIEEILEQMASDGRIAGYERLELDDLLNWVVMMIGEKVDFSEIYQQAFFLENRFHPRRIALAIYKNAADLKQSKS